MTNKAPSFWTTPQGLVALIFIGFVSYFLFIEHREHLFQWLPFLILLACPLMHVFMHGGHDHSGNGSHDKHGEAEHKAYLKGIEEGKKQRSENGDEQ